MNLFKMDAAPTSQSANNDNTKIFTEIDRNILECHALGMKCITDIYRKYPEQLPYELWESIRDMLDTVYVPAFVDKYINNFQNLLQYGRFFLEYLYKTKDSAFVSPTSVEPSLFEVDWPILQMIEINNYIYTQASTNYPYDPSFQSMFIQGCVDETIIEKLNSKLLNTNYIYIICNSAGKMWVNNLDKSDDQGFIHEYKYVISQPAGIDKKTWANTLADVYIEDPIQTNRDLYKNLIEIFKSICI